MACDALSSGGFPFLVAGFGRGLGAGLGVDLGGTGDALDD